MLSVCRFMVMFVDPALLDVGLQLLYPDQRAAELLYIYVYIYIYIYREGERDRQIHVYIYIYRERERYIVLCCVVLCCMVSYRIVAPAPSPPAR